MGEAAEMLLDGTLCEACGEIVFDDEGEPRRAIGMPDYCSPGCAKDRGADWWLEDNGYKTGSKNRKRL